jgi:hypothetical protein
MQRAAEIYWFCQLQIIFHDAWPFSISFYFPIRIKVFIHWHSLNDCGMSKLIIMNMMTTLHEQPFYFYFTAKSQVYINNFTDYVSIRLIAIWCVNFSMDLISTAHL